jgi:hypothetical protein
MSVVHFPIEEPIAIITLVEAVRFATAQPDQDTGRSPRGKAIVLRAGEI